MRRRSRAQVRLLVVTWAVALVSGGLIAATVPSRPAAASPAPGYQLGTDRPPWYGEVDAQCNANPQCHTRHVSRMLDWYKLPDLPIVGELPTVPTLELFVIVKAVGRHIYTVDGMWLPTDWGPPRLRCNWGIHLQYYRATDGKLMMVDRGPIHNDCTRFGGDRRVAPNWPMDYGRVCVVLYDNGVSKGRACAPITA